MPVDAEGNVADVVMDAASVISRTNMAKLYEHYFNGVSRDVRNRILNYLEINSTITKKTFNSIDKEKIFYCKELILELYKTISIDQYEFYVNLPDEKWEEHLMYIINKDILLYIPIEKKKNLQEIVKECEQKFKPCYGPVSYVGNSGQRVITNKAVRIAPMYIILLEKITDEWASVSVGNLNHFGVLSQITKGEKFTLPYRNSPVRTIGETEGRIFAGYCGREAMAEMFDKSNNTTTQRNVVWNILNAPTPTNIPQVVDRSFVELGGIKTLQLVGHMFRSHGFRMVYEPENK